MRMAFWTQRAKLLYDLHVRDGIGVLGDVAFVGVHISNHPINIDIEPDTREKIRAQKAI